MEEVPLALILNDGVMGGPTLDGSQDDALINEWSFRIVTDSIAEEVGVAGRVAVVVLAVVLVHPRCLEEVMRIAHLHGSAVLINDTDRFRLVGKAKHIVAELHNAWRDARLLISREAGEVDSLVLLVVALQLTAEDATEIHVVGTVVILEDGIVDRITALDGMWLGNEWAFGLVADGNAATEDACLVLGREIHVVLAVLLLHVAVPKLLGSPRNLLASQSKTFVLHLSRHGVAGDRKHMIILHVEVDAPVIFGDARVIVVRWIDENLAIKNMHRRVGHVILREKVSFHDLVMNL